MSVSRRSSQESSQIREKRFQVMIENCNDTIAMLNKQGIFTYVAPSIKKNLGYTPKEIIGQNGFNYVHPDDLKRMKKSFRHMLKKPKQAFSTELRVLHKNTSWHWIEAKVLNLLQDEDVRAIVCNFHDITDQKAAYDLLIQSEIKFRNMAENAPVMIWQANINGYCIYMNKQWYEYTGQTVKTGLGTGWLRIMHPDDEQRMRVAAFDAIKKQKPFTLTYRIRRKDGTYRWVISSGAPTYDHLGKLEGFIGSVTDIHDRIEMEQKKDNFMSIASHELKTPVTSLKAYTQLLQRRFYKSNDEFTLESLNKMDTQIDKLTHLIVDLLDVSKIEAGRLKFTKRKVAFYPLIKETVESVQTATASHTIVLKGSTRAFISGDKDRITQIVTNLITNAVKYSPKAKHVTVTVARINKIVTVCVKDFGIGINKQQQERIFERFYQGSDADPTKKVYPGLGIGLFIAQELAKSHGGIITVDSKLGKGSEFCLKLPVWGVKKRPAKVIL